MSSLEAKQEVKESVQMSVEEFVALPFSRQLEIALEDLEAYEKTPGHTIDMSVWVLPRSTYEQLGGRRSYTDKLGDIMDDPSVQCVTCLAGSAIHRRFGFESFGQANEMNNELGRVLDRISNIALCNVSPYRLNPEQFKEGIRFHIERYRAEGK